MCMLMNHLHLILSMVLSRWIKWFSSYSLGKCSSHKLNEMLPSPLQGPLRSQWTDKGI